MQPTAGECEILGHSVLRDASAARRSLGICPQQNVLFGSLTVEEHLLLYAAIKAIPGAFIETCTSSTLSSLLRCSGSRNDLQGNAAC